MRVFQALKFSFTGVISNGFLSPTIMIWMSTECQQALKIMLADLHPCFGINKNAVVEKDAISKRDRALIVAREAAEWRRNQPCNSRKVSASGMTKIDVQTVETIVYGLKTRRQGNLEQQSSMPENSLNNQPVTPRNVPVTPIPSQMQVLAVKTVHDNNSEVLLRCAKLKLMHNLDDPVNYIASFKTFGPVKNGQSHKRNKDIH